MVFFTGELKAVNERSGTSAAGKEWTSVEILVLDHSDEWNRGNPVPFSTSYGVNIDKIKGIGIGSTVKIGYVLRSNKGKVGEKYFLNANLEDIEVVSAVQQAQPTEKPPHMPSPVTESFTEDLDDDLPF